METYTTQTPNLFPVFLVAVPFVFVIIWTGATYNRLVSLRNLIRDAWANVDTELRRRYDLIPNLVETVKAYAAHERAVIESVTQARANAMGATADPGQKSETENELGRTLKSLFAVCEGYPNLKASRNFLQLQHELVNTEDRIQAARRFYNGNVRDFNTVVQSFPSNMTAGLFGFHTWQYFQVEETIARAVVSIAEEMQRRA